MRTWRRNFGEGFFAVLMVVASPVARSQEAKPVFSSRQNFPEIVSFFAPFLLPKVLQDGVRLKEYIGSDEFGAFKETYGDLYAVDAIFDEAMRLSWNNVYEALLISCAATMDHRKFGIKLPLLGPLLWVPLSSEFEDEFRIRVRALPRKLYPDTPPGGAGDRDKLQHFFGSAFLSYTFESRSISERIGEFIEWGEDAFVVDGALDERDFRANRQGQEFGLRLLADKDVLPSSFLKFAIVRKDSLETEPHSVRHEMETR
jgi:hypothetical protein